MTIYKQATYIRSTLQSILLGMILVSPALSEPKNLPSESSAQLRLISNPVDAEISINGKTKGSTPLTLTLPPGQHLLVANKKGHNAIRKTITLISDQMKTCELNLQPINGLVLIHSKPSGAEVVIDKASRGTTPVLVSNLPLGKYRVKFTKTGYLPKEVGINVNKRAPQKVDVTLRSDSAALTIDSTPQGASVTINGISRGLTPCRVDRIPSGTATLEMDLDGYDHYNETLVLSAGESQTITAPLKAIPSDLKIVTTPIKARIYVNDQFKGTSPVDLTNLEPGTYRVRAEMVAHDIMVRNVSVGRAQNLVEEFRLKPNAGSLEITTEPAGVSILLSGKTIGTTVAKKDSTDRISENLILNLIPSGTHAVTLKKVGFFDHRTEISVIRDQASTHHFTLKRRFIPNYEVKTDAEVYRGILIEVDAQRNIKLETHPGIFKTIPAQDIKYRKPLREDQLEDDI